MGSQINFKEKYKHLFKPRQYNTVCTVKDEIAEILNHFNRIVDHRFYADNRVLIEGKEGILPRHGIIVEYTGNEENFEKDFEQYLPRLEQLTKKLDKYSPIYECSFKTEFCDIDSWIDYNGTKTAYNLSL